jgi:hypothetical protein
MDAVADDILELARAFDEAELHGDPGRLGALLAEDFLSIGEQGYQLGKREWIGRHRDFRYLSIETAEVDVRRYDKTAIVRCAQRSRASWRGEAMTLAVRLSRYGSSSRTAGSSSQSSSAPSAQAEPAPCIRTTPQGSLNATRGRTHEAPDRRIFRSFSCRLCCGLGAQNIHVGARLVSHDRHIMGLVTQVGLVTQRTASECLGRGAGNGRRKGRCDAAGHGWLRGRLLGSEPGG